MNSTILIAIITNCIAIITLTTNIILTIFEKRKERNANIITKFTMDNMVLVRSSASKISVYTNPYCIKEAVDSGNKNYKHNLLMQVMHIEYVMKHIYKQEVEIIESLRRLTNIAFKYYDTLNEELTISLFKQEKEFRYLISLYDYSDWLYVKSQAVSGNRKDFNDFDDIYRNLAKKFNDVEKPKDIFFQ
jgi:hypothetical protein